MNERMLRKVRVPGRRKLYVQVFRIDMKEKWSGGEKGQGVIIPETAYEREIETGVRAKVLKLGRDVQDPDLVVGGWVLIPRFVGTKIDANAEFMLVHEDSIICHLDTEECLKEIADYGDRTGSGARDIAGNAPSAY